MASAVAAFLDHLRGRNYSPRTIESYGADLAHLIGLAGATPLERLAPHDIRRCLATLHGRGQAAGSLAQLRQRISELRARSQAVTAK